MKEALGALSNREVEFEQDNARLRRENEKLRAEVEKLRGDGREYAIVCHFQDEMDLAREQLKQSLEIKKELVQQREALHAQVAEMREALEEIGAPAESLKCKSVQEELERWFDLSQKQKLRARTALQLTAKD